MRLYKQVGNEVELCIVPRLEHKMRELFNDEINSGYSEQLADGRIYFRFQITPEKAALLHKVSEWMWQEQGQDQRS